MSHCGAGLHPSDHDPMGWLARHGGCHPRAFSVDLGGNPGFTLHTDDDVGGVLEPKKINALPCNQYAAAVSGLFDQCAGDFGAMAERAQGHADDVKLLQDAWPK